MSISFKKHSGIYTLNVSQLLPVSLEEAWSFFSSPQNLPKITPPQMRFQITSPPQAEMSVGQIITYHVYPLYPIKTNWVTEITHVEPRKKFVDEQRFGPYAMWHHEHIFEPRPEGVFMTDRVSYKLPFGYLGNLANFLFVKRQLHKIFSYRKRVLRGCAGIEMRFDFPQRNAKQVNF